MESTTNNSVNNTTEIIQIDFRKWFFKILAHWWLFLLGLAIAIPAGYTYLRYAVNEYSTRAVLLIKDAGRSGGISAQQILAQDVGLSGSAKAMDNEVQILLSLTLMERVVEKLNINIRYFREGRFKDRELYNESSVVLDTFELSEERMANGVSFLINTFDENFIFKRNIDDEGIVYQYDQPIINDLGKFVITKDPQFEFMDGIYRIAIEPISYVAADYKSKLKVERIGDPYSSSVLELSLQDRSSAKAADILNTLIQVYNEEDIKDMNKVLRNTIDFIDIRVEKLSKELDIVEGGIERFKSRNAIITENAASSMSFTLGEMRGYIQQLSSLEVKKSILASLESFLLDDKLDFELIPNNLISDNPTLTGLVSKYNELLLQRDALALTATELNPTRQAIESRLTDIRALILETLKNLRKDLSIPIKEVEQNIDDLQKSVASVPTIEKQLIEQMRTQKIKEDLFLFLLRKREETTLSEAITAERTRVVERARVNQYRIYPQPRLIYLACTVLGLLIPLLLLILRSFFETKITTEEELKQLVNIPIVGQIALSKKKEDIVVRAGNRSAISEMFRLLRTNLNYLNVKEDKQVTLVTSSISGEGKSFIAINLAMAMALANKKVVLLGLDLRKPKMSKYLGMEEIRIGVTNYLIGENEPSEIINQYKDNPNLSFITSGPIPPNPAELLLSDKMGELIEYLKKDFDYILLDTPPIGLVSDALLLRQYTTGLLVVVRQNYTRKIMLKNLENMYQKGELKGAGLVFNGIKTGKSYYGYGGYQYGYGYGQGYYVEN